MIWIDIDGFDFGRLWWFYTGWAFRDISHFDVVVVNVLIAIIIIIRITWTFFDTAAITAYKFAKTYANVLQAVSHY